MKGKIKNFNLKRENGFICGEDGNDYFFRITSIEKPKDEFPLPGEQVEFRPGRNFKGNLATHVVIIL